MYNVCAHVLVFLLVSLIFLKNKTIFKTEKANLAVSKVFEPHSRFSDLKIL